VAPSQPQIVVLTAKFNTLSPETVVYLKALSSSLAKKLNVNHPSRADFDSIRWKSIRELDSSSISIQPAVAKALEQWSHHPDHFFTAYNWHKIDYGYLLQDCYDTGAEWIAIIEDDTIARKDWYTQALDALSAIQQRSSSLSSWV
jgi:hypothetical protein